MNNFTELDKAINDLECQLITEEELTQVQINEINRQLDNLYDQSGKKRKWTLENLHIDTRSHGLAE